MYDAYASSILWAVIAVQFLGLFSALVSRLGKGLCQCFFLLCLTLVGGTTFLSLSLGPGGWLTCGATLSLMVVIALYDCGEADRATI